MQRPSTPHQAMRMQRDFVRAAIYARGHANPDVLKGADKDRAQAAVDKRARRSAKRVEDATAAAIGELKSREALNAGIPRGFWPSGVYATFETIPTVNGFHGKVYSPADSIEVHGA